NKFLTVVIVAGLFGAGLWSLRHIPLDALPDLSDVQVIVYTNWEGQNPNLIEDQVTYPIVSALISAPRVKTVRGYSFFGFSYVYVIFQDGTDLYWARSRVLEYLNGLRGQLPEGVNPNLGPDATGVGWGFEYVLVDKTGQHSLADLRTFQDWDLSYWLRAVPGVAEVSSVGGFQKQYQVEVDPTKLASYGIGLPEVLTAVKESNGDVGGRVVEWTGREYMVRGRGYIQSLEDLQRVPIKAQVKTGTPVYLSDVATIHFGPEMRRGIVDWNGEGEAIGGVVVVRAGENVLSVVEAVKKRIAELAPSFPPGVELKVAYDRSELIHRAIDTLKRTLIEEVIVVAIVTLMFLFHFRSALVPITVLPVAIVISFLPMALLHVSSNIMSLGGLALAIGVLVDASIVMVENAHRHLAVVGDDRRAREGAILAASQQVGRAIFFSLVIIVVSFLPVFLLTGEEGRLFHPLAFTKTFAIASASILSITLVPILMGAWMRGKIRSEDRNPAALATRRLYAPVLNWALRWPKTTLLLNFLLIPAVIPLALSLGSEFMPQLREGSLMYMPTGLPMMSVEQAREILVKTDGIIMSFPEVQSVLGKSGKFESSTDPAPVEMFETTIVLKPREEWPKAFHRRWYSGWPGWIKPIFRPFWPEMRVSTQDELIASMNERLQVPGMPVAWTQPIRNRLDMLATGVRTKAGVKVYGADYPAIEKVSLDVENALKDLPGARSVYAERTTGGTYLDFVVDRDAAARYGLSVMQIQNTLEAATGGKMATTTVEGRRRFSVLVRYPRDYRSDIESLRRILVMTPGGVQVPLGQLAQIRVTTGPPMYRDENGRLSGIVYVDTDTSDLAGFVRAAQQRVSSRVKLPPGITIDWTGQYEFQVHARKTLQVVLPIVFAVIFFLLTTTFRSASEASIVMLSVVYAMTGGVVLQWLLGYNFSVAVWIGYIALYGVAVETGVIMVIYLHEALDRRLSRGAVTRDDIVEATREGSVLRLRPKLMTVAAATLSLIPIFWSTGAGSEVMRPIATPIVGGMVTSTIHVLLVTPVIFLLMKERARKKGKLRLSGMRANATVRRDVG
ncbi:MAG TPA: CusA/CzcA family heavy metal efflux RND transporter, partial [Thermoanaerobaculia bacterium]